MPGSQLYVELLYLKENIVRARRKKYSKVPQKDQSTTTIGPNKKWSLSTKCK